MALPHFICLGAQKAGTRWVYDQFSDHASFWKAPIKELTYFDRGGSEANRIRAKRRLAWRMRKQERGKGDYTADIAFLQRYLALSQVEMPLDVAPYKALFTDKPGLTFDCTPGYSRLGVASVRAMLTLQDTRFFLILRDPAERLWSQAQMHARLARQPYDPTESVANLARFASRDSVRRFSFLSETVRLWRAEAGGRFRAFAFDDLRQDPASFRAELARFLDVDPEGFAGAAGHNRKDSRPGRIEVPPSIAAWMAELFADEYRALADLGLPHADRWYDRNQSLRACAA